MPGILDPTNPYPDFLDPSGAGLFDSPEYKRQRLFDTLGGIGAALLQSGAQGNDFGTSLALGLAGGAQAGRGAEDRIMRRMLTASQVAKNRSEMANETAWRDMFKTPIASSGAAPQPSAVPMGSSGMDLPRARAAIKGNESGGRYDAVGPDTGRGRAYGAYQVMDFNIGPWTQEVLGRAYTPQEFLADEKAQDAVFDAKFGGYWKQYGNPQDAASMWFSGKPVQQAGNATDVLGTSVPTYLARFNRGMTGGFSPTNVPAQNIPGGLPQSPVIAQGDATPIQPVQAQQPAFRPQTMQEVIQTIPPGVRQLIGAMPRKEGLPILMKYADPGSEAVIDTQSGQVVFIPKTMVGRDPRYQPVEGAKLQIERDKLINDQRRTDSALDNAEVIRQGGRPVLNPTIQSGKEAETQRKMLEGDYTDARKANSTAQEGGLMARQGLANIDRLSGLLDQVSTGRFTSTTQEIKAIAKSFGVDLTAMGIADNVGPGQAAQALSNQIALTLRNPAGGAGMPGALSDQDRTFLQQMIPSLETTPEGRKLMVEYMRRVYQRQIDIAKISNDFMRSADAKRDPGALYTKIQEFADANPLFDPKKDVPSGGMSPMPSQGGGSIPAPPAGFRIVR